MEGGELPEPKVVLQTWDMDGEEEKTSFPFIGGKEQDVVWMEQLSITWLQPLQSCLQTSTNSSTYFLNEQYIYENSVLIPYPY